MQQYPRRYKRPKTPSIIDRTFKEASDWREQAACKPANTQIFFPNANAITRINRDEVEKAFEYCEKCPVAGYCMYEAIVYDYDGIWARSLPRQRNAYVKHYYPSSLENFTPNDAYLFYKELCGKSVDPTRRYAKRKKRLVVIAESVPTNQEDDMSSVDRISDV